MVCKSVSIWSVDWCMCAGILLWRVCARAPAAAMTLSSGVTCGVVMYLCLKKAAPDIWVARVVVDQNLQHR